ncbi:MAG TPA: peptide ABC transporter substrate-binding protein [Chloroflexia bacterium]|nr:peptide ABC transporter substrate-binding protein [Chloroflexia bacterium]
MRRHLTGTAPRRPAVLLLSVLIILGLSGCWPFPTDATPPPAGTLTPAAGQSFPTPAPGALDALDITGSVDDPPTLDPALSSDNYSNFIIRQIYSGLVTFDSKLNIVPDLAAAMPSVSADGKTYTFALRKGVHFPDRQEVTSSDFKYSFERAADPKLAGSQPASSLPAGLYLDDIVGVNEKLQGKAPEIEGVKAPDPYTLVITIDAPKSYFLSKLVSGPALVVQRTNVESGSSWTERPRGTGPYTLEKWVHDQQIVLAPNKDYYGAPPSLPLINIWMGANATGELQQYEKEDSNLEVADVSVDDIDRVSDRNNPLSKELQSVPDLSITYLGFNLRQKPFDDPKIREALSRVIDRQKIARVMFQSRVRQASGFVPPNMAGYTGPETDDLYNVTRARQLISESTYKEVKNLPKIRLYTSGGSLEPMLKDVYSETLGLDIEVHSVEWTDYLAGLDRGDYPMFTLSWVADYPDPESILGSLFRSSSPSNHTGYRNADVDAALNAAATETSQTKRMSTYEQVEARVLADYPAVPLYHSIRYTLIKPYVQGLNITPMGILDLRDVRLIGR